MPTNEWLIMGVVASLKAMTLVSACVDSGGGLSSKTFLIAEVVSKENIRDAFEYADTPLGSGTLALSIVTLTAVEGVTIAMARATWVGMGVVT